MMMSIDNTDELVERITAIVETAGFGAGRANDAAMVQAYWEIGSLLAKPEQPGRARAELGRAQIELISARLTKRFSRGFGRQTLLRMRQYYAAFPEGSTIREPRIVAALGRRSKALDLVDPSCGPSSEGGEIIAAPRRRSSRAARFPPNLGWTHYRMLLAVQDPCARAFYEVEAARNNWTTRELERQIDTRMFERLATGRNAEEVRVLAQEGQRAQRPADLVKEPMVLEFVGLPEHRPLREGALEQALMDNLEMFLLELGSGFGFVSRQRRLIVNSDRFYVDLVFYHQHLRCFVLIELKVGKLTHHDLGQMQMYVNYFDLLERTELDNPTIGLVLCSEKNDAMMEIALPGDNQRILAARYQLHLPSADESVVPS